MGVDGRLSAEHEEPPLEADEPLPTLSAALRGGRSVAASCCWRHPSSFSSCLREQGYSMRAACGIVSCTGLPLEAAIPGMAEELYYQASPYISVVATPLPRRLFLLL